MQRRARQFGFTLIELMVVISIIVILMSVAIPRYQASILRARETVLRDDLYTLRSVIDQYTLDKQKAPQSLQDLVDSGYLKTLPLDPFTNSRDSWIPVTDDSVMSPDQSQPGIIDVQQLVATALPTCALRPRPATHGAASLPECWIGKA